MGAQHRHRVNFHQLPLWIVENEGTLPGWERVWMNLRSLDEFGSKKITTPSESWLGKKCKMSDRTVRKAIQHFVEIGALRVWRRQGKSSVFKTYFEPPSHRATDTPEESSDVSGNLFRGTPEIVSDKVEKEEVEKENSASADASSKLELAENTFKNASQPLVEALREAIGDPGYHVTKQGYSMLKTIWENCSKDVEKASKVFRVAAARRDTDHWWKENFDLKLIVGKLENILNSEEYRNEGTGAVQVDKDAIWRQFEYLKTKVEEILGCASSPIAIVPDFRHPEYYSETLPAWLDDFERKHGRANKPIGAEGFGSHRIVSALLSGPDGFESGAKHMRERAAGPSFGRQDPPPRSPFAGS